MTTTSTVSIDTYNSPISIRTTSNPSDSDLSTFITLLSEAYLSVPLTTAFISEIDGTTAPYPSPSITPSRLQAHFKVGITAAAKSNILLKFAYSSSESSSELDSSTTPLAAGLFEPPSFTGIPPSHARKQPGPILLQYRDHAKTLKSQYLSIPDSGPKSYTTPAAPSQSAAAPSEDPYPTDFNKEAGTEIRPFYHIAFVARDLKGADQREAKRAVRAMVKEIQDRAREEEVAVWMTTSQAESRDEFQHMGFGVVDDVGVIGKGLVGSDGWPKEGGEGIKVWGLLWE